MKLTSLRKWKPRQRKNARAWTYGKLVRLIVEILEDRVVPSSVLGTNTVITNPSLPTTPAASGDLPPVPSNLGFESGLDGWSVNTDDSGALAVVTQFEAHGGTIPNSEQVVPPQMFNPVEGKNFALLTTAGTNAVTTLSKTFAIGQGGQLISFSAFFDAGDYAPFNDYGDVVLYKDGSPLVTLFASNINGGDGLDSHPPVPLLAPLENGGSVRHGVGTFGYTPWTTVQYKITTPGNYSLVGRAANTGDDALNSYLGLDDVQFLGAAELTANAGPGYTVPGGGTVNLHGFGTTDHNLPLTYAWDLNYDGETFNPTAFGQDVAFSSVGIEGGSSRTVALQVSNGQQSVISTANVAVIDQLAVFGDARPDAVNVGTPLVFPLPFTDPDSRSWTGKIYYGDGTIQALTNAQLAGKQISLNHIYTEDGAFAITIFLTDDGGAPTSVTFDVLVNPVLTTINVGDPITVPSGTVVDRTITFTAPVVENWSVLVDSLGTGNLTPFTGPVFTSSTPGGINTIEFKTTYTKPGTYNVEFSFDNGFDAPQVVFLPINIFLTQQFVSLNNISAQPVTDAGQTTQTNTVSGSSLDGTTTQLDATLGAGAPVGSSIFTASYTSNPISNSQTNTKSVIKVSGSSPASPTAFFDLRASFVGPVDNPILACDFTVEMDPTQNINDLKVLYSNGNNPDGSPIWQVFQADPDFPVTRTVIGIDPANQKEIVKIHVTYDKNTNPSVFDLHGTVFTIAVPPPQEAPPTITPVSGPVALLNGVPPTRPLTTSFSSDSGGTFVLSVSQGTDFSASRTEASTAFSSVTSGTSWYDPANALQNYQASLDDNWYLRALAVPGDDINAIRPAFGEDQQNPPITPRGPVIDNQESSLPLQKEPLDVLFAEESFEETDMPLDPLDLLQPRLVELDISKETRTSAAWALWAAAAGSGLGHGSERKRRRPELESLPV